jgi:hypothetical protein
MWWEHGKERLLEKVNSLDKLAMQSDFKLIAAMVVYAPETA